MKQATKIRFVLLLGACLLLELACRIGWISKHAVTPPTIMVQEAINAVSSSTLRYEIFVTLWTVGFAFLLAVTVGFAIGVVLFALPRLRKALDPFLVSYYAVPTFVLYPVFVVLLGVGRIPLVAIGFVFAVVVMIVNTLDGLSRIPRAFTRTAQVMGLTTAQTLFYVVLPAISPWLLTGVKFALVYSFISVIAGEFILSGVGIGYQIAFMYESFFTAKMYGLILLLFFIVGGINMSIWVWEQKIHERRKGR